MFRLNLFLSFMIYFLLCVLLFLFVCVFICVWKTFGYQSILSVLCLADKVYIFCLVCHVRVSLCSCNSRAILCLCVFVFFVWCVFVFVQFSCTANVTLSTVKRHPVVAHSLPQNGNKYPWPQETTYNLAQICPSFRTIVFLLSKKYNEK